MKLLFLLIFGLFSTIAGQEVKPFEILLLTKAEPLSDVVKAFNTKFSDELNKLNTPHLTENELKCALAIGSGFYCDSEKIGIANLCVDSYMNCTLPAGSSLALYTKEEMDSPNSVHVERFIFIYLRISTLNYDEKNWRSVPDDKMLKSTASFPVRLVPIVLKK